MVSQLLASIIGVFVLLYRTESVPFPTWVTLQHALSRHVTPTSAVLVVLPSEVPSTITSRNLFNSTWDEVLMESYFPKEFYIWFHTLGGVTLLRTTSGSESLTEYAPARLAEAVFIVTVEAPLSELKTAISTLQRNAAWSSYSPHIVLMMKYRQLFESKGKTNEEVWNTKDGQEANEEESLGTIYDDENKLAAKLINKLWRNNVGHAVLVDLNADQLEYLWWSPLGKGHDCKGPTEISIRRFPIYRKFPAFIFGRMNNYYNGCILKAASYLLPPFTILPDNVARNSNDIYLDGLEVKIQREISNRLNLTIHIVGDIMDFNLVPEMVENGSADFSLGGYFLSNWFVPAMDFTDFFFVDYVVWFVPSGVPIDRWKSVALVFSLPLWLLSVVSCLAVALVFKALRASGRKDSPGATDAPIMLLGIGLPKIPSGLLTRTVFFAWLLGSFIINNSYQSALVGFLANPGISPPIRNTEELLRSKLTIGLHEVFVDIFKSDFDEPIYKTLLLRSEVCSNMNDCFDRIAFSRVLAVPYDLPYVEYNYFGPGRKMINVMDTIAIYFITFLFTKGHPLKELWNFYLCRLIESGFNDKWWKDMISQNGPLSGESISRSDSKPEVMTLVTLEGPFLILIVGLLVSLLAFTSEYLYSVYLKR